MLTQEILLRMHKQIEAACGIGTCTTSNSQSSLTADEILLKIEAAQLRLKSLGSQMVPQQWRSSPYATKSAPMREHKKRKNQTEAYHRRVQKKWAKRFGTKQVPAAYLIDNGVLGGRGQSLVVHPDLLRKVATC